MTKIKTVAIVGSVFGAVVLVGGLVFWQVQHHKKLAHGFDPGNGSTHVAAADQASDTSAASSVGSGLSVGGSGGSDLGQLINQQKQSASSGGSSSTSSGSNGGSGLPDPSTFAQYDKYKDGTSALFSDVQKGSGDELTAGKKAAVYYEGWLTNGQLFDASRQGSDGKIQAFSFTLGSHEVIPGWEQGMVGMKVGGIRMLVIPPSVGYGNQAQASIPANSVLVFAVQLVAVQ